MGSEAIVIPIIIDPKEGVAGLKAVGEAATQANKQFDAGSTSAGKFGNVMKALSANAFAVFESFNLIHHGVKLVVEAFLDSIAGFKKLASVQNMVAEAQRKAIEATQGEVVELQALYNVAKNTALTYEQRQGAIERLNKQYPELHNNLRLETIGNREVADSIQDVINNLVKKEQAEILIKKIAELKNSIIAAQEAGEKLKFSPLAKENERVIFSLQGRVLGLQKSLEGLFSNLNIKAPDTSGLGKYFGDIDVPKLTLKPGKIDVKTPPDFGKIFQGYDIDIIPPEVAKNEGLTFAQMFGQEVAAYFANNDPTDFSLISAVNGYNDANEAAKKLLDTQKQQADLVANFLSPAFDGFVTAVLEKQDALKSFFEGIGQSVKQLIRQLIQAALRAAVLSLLTGGVTTIGGVARKGFGQIFQGLLGFAAGGLVTGPVSALVGEGPGTSHSNPEVVAPLDKLRNFFSDMIGQNRSFSTSNMGMAGAVLSMPQSVRVHASGRDLVGIIEMEYKSQGMTG